MHVSKKNKQLRGGRKDLMVYVRNSNCADETMIYYIEKIREKVSLYLKLKLIGYEMAALGTNIDKVTPEAVGVIVYRAINSCIDKRKYAIETIAIKNNINVVIKTGTNVGNMIFDISKPKVLDEIIKFIANVVIELQSVCDINTYNISWKTAKAILGNYGMILKH